LISIIKHNLICQSRIKCSALLSYLKAAHDTSNISTKRQIELKNILGQALSIAGSIQDRNNKNKIYSSLVDASIFINDTAIMDILSKKVENKEDRLKLFGYNYRDKIVDIKTLEISTPLAKEDEPYKSKTGKNYAPYFLIDTILISGINELNQALLRSEKIKDKRDKSNYLAFYFSNLFEHITFVPSEVEYKYILDKIYANVEKIIHEGIRTTILQYIVKASGEMRYKEMLDKVHVSAEKTLYEDLRTSILQDIAKTSGEMRYKEMLDKVFASVKKLTQDDFRSALLQSIAEASGEMGYKEMLDNVLLSAEKITNEGYRSDIFYCISKASSKLRYKEMYDKLLVSAEKILDEGNRTDIFAFVAYDCVDAGYRSLAKNVLNKMLANATQYKYIENRKYSYIFICKLASKIKYDTVVYETIKIANGLQDSKYLSEVLTMGLAACLQLDNFKKGKNCLNGIISPEDKCIAYFNLYKYNYCRNNNLTTKDDLFKQIFKVDK